MLPCFRSGPETRHIAHIDIAPHRASHAWALARYGGPDRRGRRRGAERQRAKILLAFQNAKKDSSSVY